MAMQAGLSVSKILFIAGAGYTSMVMVQKGKMSDLLGELQAFVKGLEKSGDQTDGDGEYGDAIAAQLQRIASDVRQLPSSSMQITVQNGNTGQLGNFSSLVVPAATLGALGYSYMWWKGFSFADLMYVTKRNMSNAVSNLTKHLESVSEALANAKKHLTQRIQNLDDKMLKQNEISRMIKDDVAEVQKTLTDIDDDLSALQRMVQGLDGRIMSLEDKQDFANVGIEYLLYFVNGKKMKLPEELQDKLRITGKAGNNLLTYPDWKGLKAIIDTVGINRSASDAINNDTTDMLQERPRTILRAASTRC